MPRKNRFPFFAGPLLSLFITHSALAAAPKWCSAESLTPVEKTICTDPSLSAADIMVDQLYQSVLSYRGQEGHEGHWPGEVISNQRDWLASRSLLIEKSDILDAYTARINALANALKNRWID